MFGQLLFGQLLFGQLLFGQLLFGQLLFGQLLIGQLLGTSQLKEVAFSHAVPASQRANQSYLSLLNIFCSSFLSLSLCNHFAKPFSTSLLLFFILFFCSFLLISIFLFSKFLALSFHASLLLFLLLSISFAKTSFLSLFFILSFCTFLLITTFLSISIFYFFNFFCFISLSLFSHLSFFILPLPLSFFTLFFSNRNWIGFLTDQIEFWWKVFKTHQVYSNIIPTDDIRCESPPITTRLKLSS